MKKLPPWALVAGAVAIGAVIWLIRKRKQEQLEKEQQQETASEAPYVTGVGSEEGGEGFPYSVGSALGGGGAGAIGNALESQSELSEIFRSEQGFLSESQKQEGEFENTLARQLRENSEALQAQLTASRATSTVAQGSGGGAPEEVRRGTTAAPKTQGATCGQGQFAGFPNGTAPNCWRVSRTKTGGGCECHGYHSGQLECQHGKAPHCVW